MQTPHLPTDDRFLDRDWKARRAAWYAFWALLVVALLGVFGDGPLSTARASGGGAELRYERFVRHDSTLILRLAAGSGEAEVHVPLTLFGEHDEVRCRPEPDRERMGPDGRTWTFARSPDAATDVRIDWKPYGRGWRSGTIRAGEDRLDVWAWLHP